MAYKNIVLQPNNISNQNSVKQSQFYKGFSTVGTPDLSNKLYDYNLVKQDIINQFQTRKGERLMNPNFGTIIWDVIFEPFTAAIKQQISDDVTRILNSDPRAIPTKILIIETDSGMLIDAILYYSQTNQSEQLAFNFDRTAGTVGMQ